MRNNFECDIKRYYEHLGEQLPKQKELRTKRAMNVLADPEGGKVLQNAMQPASDEQIDTAANL